jgi:arylsulfatase A-like enzyme
VFIDAQAPSLTLGNDYQNFMTVQERSVIDHVFLLHDVEPQDADEALGKIIAGELRQGGPVFIYANKNGAHFPYDHSYPASAAIFHPTMTESAADTVEARSNSFRNGIAWSVDRFMEQLFAETDFKDTTMIYTSDHGQQLMPGKLTHCQAEKPDQMMSVVPLMVHTSDPDLRKKFEAGAAVLQNKASHFQIAPTLYSLMGYRAEDIAKQYDESLFIGTSRPAESTSGDVFGLFRPSQNWNAVDLQAISSEQNPALVVKAKPITANVGG